MCIRDSTSGPQRAIAEVLEKAGKTEADMAYTLATGYGRNSLEDIADHQMSELSCHAKGATFLFPDVHTVIDIGGQDLSLIHIFPARRKAALPIWVKSVCGVDRAVSAFRPICST